MSNNLVPIQPSEGLLTDLVPVTHRKRVYALFGLVGLLLGATFVGFLAANDMKLEAIPQWLTVAVAVYLFLTPFFSKLATDNAVPVGEEAIELVLDADAEDDKELNDE